MAKVIALTGSLLSHVNVPLGRALNSHVAYRSSYWCINVCMFLSETGECVCTIKCFEWSVWLEKCHVHLVYHFYNTGMFIMMCFYMCFHWTFKILLFYTFWGRKKITWLKTKDKNIFFSFVNSNTVIMKRKQPL